jgi:hypothetical protein
MTKIEFNKHNLANLVDYFLKTGNERELTQYLISKSNLPGPRGNLELAKAFADLVEVNFSKNPERLWGLCIKAIEISSDEAPVNDPKEFLTFCGAYGLGSIGSVSSSLFDKALFLLKELARDSRWRTREAVAMGLQKMLARKPEETLKALDGWIENSDWLVMRAVVAGVAEPYLLRNVQTARKALEYHKKIFAKILAAKERKSHEFKVMRKGLGYTFSVVICGLPKEGFRLMRKVAASQDADILWIVKQNLGKNRLIRNFPEEVTSVKNRF